MQKSEGALHAPKSVLKLKIREGLSFNSGSQQVNPSSLCFPNLIVIVSLSVANVNREISNEAYSGGFRSQRKNRLRRLLRRSLANELHYLLFLECQSIPVFTIWGTEKIFSSVAFFGRFATAL